MTPSELLEAVEFDDRLSTPTAEVYWSRWDIPLLRSKVIHEPRTGAWRCEPQESPGIERKHIERAKRVRAIRWWLALVGDWSDDELNLLASNRTIMLLSEHGNEDDQAAIDAVAVITERRQLGRAA